MNDEIINAALMRLKSKALEHYGLLKSTYQDARGTDTVDEMCKHAIAMVQFEGAMITLQQYAPALNETPPADEPSSPEAPAPSAGGTMTTEELAKRSPTFRKSQTVAKSKKKKKKDE
jgi:hypothetical protein|tara:strand:- start:3936 stop:4286 length:351 start_codon:yes stop_codon:yes gene_type:complete